MSIADNVVNIHKRINDSALRVNRDPAGIRLIAATKYSTVDQMNDAIRSGITEVGENRVQDGQRKFPFLVNQVKKHLIGSLQSNKVKQAINEFDFIHSVDRPELVLELAKQTGKLGKQVQILIQVNIAGEVTKHGASPDQVGELLSQIKQYPYLIPVGLMTIAPLVSDPEQIRPIFRHLRDLFVKVGGDLNMDSEWRYLSMGMSQDFEVAIEEGANLLRIGTALFN